MKILDNLPELGSLTRESEDDLARTGTEEAYTALALFNMREAWVYTRQVCRGKLQDDEIYSLCYAALMKAAKRFNPVRRTRFFAYSKVYLRGELSRWWESKNLVKHAHLHETELPLDTAGGLSRPDLAQVQPDFQTIFANERWALVKPVMDSVLSEHEKMILTLIYGSGFSYSAIGGLLDISRSAVGETHNRAISKVRVALASKGTLFE